MVKYREGIQSAKKVFIRIVTANGKNAKRKLYFAVGLIFGGFSFSTFPITGGAGGF